MRGFVATAVVIVAFASRACADEPVNFQCGTPGSIQAWIVGDNADIVDIVFNGKRIFRDEVRDGNLSCTSDIMIGSHVVVVRYGRDRDSLKFYRVTLTQNTIKVSHAKFEWREGAIKLVSNMDDNNMVFYAVHDKDLYTRICWKDEMWMYTPGRWSAGSLPQTCTVRLNTEVAK